ncbi:MAG: hypothetical protein WCR07_05395 [Verrucomicrobiota bacterium]|jgi:hypothetical protein
MKLLLHRSLLVLVLSWWAVVGRAQPAVRPLPPALVPWQEWATWDQPHRACPTPWSDPKTHRCFWPGRLDLAVTDASGAFVLSVVVFHGTWVPLPGAASEWPQEVRANGDPVPVLERDGVPCIHLGPGEARIQGAFQWDQVPQSLRIPPSIGLLTVSRDGKALEAPAWDAAGTLWLRRDGATGSAERDAIEAKAYALLEDGIPMWWRQELEVTVAGKSREEDLGNLIPAGWRLASVAAPIPVTVDDAGRAKAQVRAGKWTIQVDAFRVDDSREIHLPTAAKPPAADMLVAFKARPDLRTLEISGATAIDAAQTYVLPAWRDLPVYRWEPARPIVLAERMRGMGDKKPGGLGIERELWLDEDGRGLTFRDTITGSMQQVWRLDAAEGQQLGSVRSLGIGQLVTRNPASGALGFEVRARNLAVEATGRADATPTWPATGWRADADPARVTLHLPPGWRLFALFGSDWVQGDWLTAWTLLDLFLLLVFTLAVFRLRGFGAAALAFLAFGLAYHEPGAPRYPWLVLLVPLALGQLLRDDRARRLARVVQGTAAVVLVLFLVPFVSRQVQQALYPQLELTPGYPTPDLTFAVGDVSAGVALGAQVQANQATVATDARFANSLNLASRAGTQAPAKDAQNNYWSANLLQDAKARIQTGPGIPEWTWRAVSFGWNGPVQPSQNVRPILVPRSVERLLSVVRTGLVMALAAVLAMPAVRRKESSLPAPPSGSPPHAPEAPAVAAVVLGIGLGLAILAGPSVRAAEPSAPGPIPDATTLDKLRERLLAPSDAYPNAASIPMASLGLEGRRVRIEAEIHAALRVAVPIPGRLPAFSPVAVEMDGKPAASVRRDDGFLWVVVEPGVHRVRLDAWLPSVSEWEWSFALKPRRVRIDAPEWTVAGVRGDGVPEAQVFLAPRLRATSASASYEQQRVESVVAIDRHIELGLQWQVRSVVTRLSPMGRAVSLLVPLVPGETVVSQGAVVRDGAIEIRLGAQERETSWEGTLAVTNQVPLGTNPTNAWVERWHLVTSPVWNITLSGLPPMFDATGGDLVPSWRPWPGESVGLAIQRPEAVAGSTVTINRALHAASLGRRQRTSTLDLALRCSMGEEFPVGLPPGSEVTRLSVRGRDVPVRREGDRVVVPLQPGEQSMSIEWKESRPLGFRDGNAVVQLPVEAANVMTTATVGQDRWVLWASGPQRGPAVRFWGVLLLSLLGAVALGRIPRSPLGTVSWMLLLVGLTQAHLVAAMVSIGWFFLVRWRGEPSFPSTRPVAHNLLQVALVVLTAATVGILLFVVGEGLLGSPRMFILGNQSTRTLLRWFEPRAGTSLPGCTVFSISIWWYRLLMLLWALWLAWSLLEWLGKAWRAFVQGGILRRRAPSPAPTPKNPPPAPPQPPPLPTSA